MALHKAIELDESYKENLLKKLENCIEKLPKKCKEMFFRKKITGLKTKDIALNFNISTKTVEGHITKAYKLLKDCMKNIEN